MNKKEAEQFKADVDSWIKSFKGDLATFSSEIDDCTDDVTAHREELQFNFENLCRLETRIDKIEGMLESVLYALEFTKAKDKFSNVQPLKDKSF